MWQRSKYACEILSRKQILGTATVIRPRPVDEEGRAIMWQRSKYACETLSRKQILSTATVIRPRPVDEEGRTIMWQRSKYACEILSRKRVLGTATVNMTVNHSCFCFPLYLLLFVAFWRKFCYDGCISSSFMYLQQVVMQEQDTNL